MQTAYSVIPLPNINTMIVTGSPSQLTQVDNLITRVDVRRKQVLIDAVVMDREKGSINVGQNVPFLVSTETSNNGSLVQKIERQNVGLGLSVVPHIVNDSVILAINQTSSSVSDSDITSDIITNNREINTVVQVLDGQSIILGGLVSDESRQSESGVPLLKDIPWIGGLFRTTSDKSVSSQMSVLIKVTVI